MSKFWTLTIVKCLFLIGLLCSLQINVLASPCAKGLAEISTRTESLDSALDEYANLIFTVEQTSPEAPFYIMLSQAAEAKGREISDILAPSDQENFKQKLRQKLKLMRAAYNSELQIHAEDEALQRQSEDYYLNIRFQPEEPRATAEAFWNGKLSPDKRSLLIARKIGENKNSISLLSLPDGRKVFETVVPKFTRDAEFIHGGKFLSIDYVDRNSIFKFVPFIELAFAEIIDVKTGKSLIRRKYIKGDMAFKHLTLDVSRDGKRALILKGKKLKVLDLVTRKAIDTNFSEHNMTFASFDDSGENILVRTGSHKTTVGITSFNLKTGKINCQKMGFGYKCSDDRKYIFDVDVTSDKRWAKLIEVSSGRELHDFNNPDEVGALASKITMSPDGKYIVYPIKGDMSLIYKFENDKVTYLWTLKDYPHGVQFFDDSQKLSTVDRWGNFSVWNPANGIRLKLEHGEGVRFFWGLDADDNLISSRKVNVDAQTIGLKDLSIRRRF